MVEAGEEAAHKGYIVLLPLKWQKYHDENGKRVKPLLQGKKHTFVHMLTERKESLKAADNAASGATQGQGKGAMTGVKNARLKELLAEKQEEEAREAARIETLRLSKIVERQKERIRQRREKAIEEANPVLLSSCYETTLHLTKGNTTHEARIGRTAEKVLAQSERHRAITERRLQDVPEATQRHQFAKTLSLARKVAAEGNLIDPFFKPVGKKRDLVGPFFMDPSKKRGESVLHQAEKAIEEQVENKMRSTKRKLQHEDELEKKIVVSANAKAQKLRAGEIRRDEAAMSKIDFAVKHQQHWNEVSVAPSIIPMRHNETNKIDVGKARKAIVDEAQRERADLEQQWDEYTRALTDRFHFTLKSAQNRENDHIRAYEKCAQKEKELQKRNHEALQRRKELDMYRREVWAERKAATEKVEANFAKNVDAMADSYDKFFETYKPEPACGRTAVSYPNYNPQAYTLNSSSPRTLRAMSPVTLSPTREEEWRKEQERSERRKAAQSAKEVAAYESLSQRHVRDVVREERLDETRREMERQHRERSVRREHTTGAALESFKEDIENKVVALESSEAAYAKRRQLYRREQNEIRREEQEVKDAKDLRIQQNFIKRENNRLDKYPVIQEKRRVVRERGAERYAAREKACVEMGEVFNDRRGKIAVQLQDAEANRDAKARRVQDERETACRETLQRVLDERQGKIEAKRQRDLASRQQMQSDLDNSEQQRQEALRKQCSAADAKYLQAARNRRELVSLALQDKREAGQAREEAVNKRFEDKINSKLRSPSHKKYLVDVEKLISPKKQA